MGIHGVMHQARKKAFLQSSMHLLSRLLLLVSKEAISGKNYPNQPPPNERTINLE